MQEDEEFDLNNEDTVLASAADILGEKTNSEGMLDKEEDGLEDESTVLARTEKDGGMTNTNDLQEVDLQEVDVDGDPELRDLESMNDNENLEDMKGDDILQAVEGIEESLPDDPDAEHPGSLEPEEEPWPDEEETWPDEDEPWPEDDDDEDDLFETEAGPQADQEEEVSESPEDIEEFDAEEQTIVTAVPGKEEPSVDVEEYVEDATIVTSNLSMQKPTQDETPSITSDKREKAPEVDLSLPGEKKKKKKRQPMKKAWVVVAILIMALVIGIVSQTEWWVLTSHNLRSQYRLVSVKNHWQKREFGTLLTLNGKLSNNDSRRTPSPPLIYISLMDKTNKVLLSTRVIPGRVVSKSMLNDSGEQAIREIILLQRRKQTPAEMAWTEETIAFQALFINPPEEVVHFQVDFNTPKSPNTTTGAISNRP